MGWHIKKSSLQLILALLLVATILPLPVSADGDVEALPLGCELSPAAGEYLLVQGPARVAGTTLPASVDLRAGLPPVADQGRQNSCVAWAVGYYLKSYQEAREQLWSLTAREHQFSPAYVYNQRPTTDCRLDRGMTILAALRIMQQGAAPLAVAPYSQRDTCAVPGAAVRDAAREYRAGSFGALFQSKGRANVQQIKTYLAAGTPVILAIPVYSNFRDALPGKSVIGAPAAGSSSLGTHAVLAVGYDAQGILIVNSWGTRWGEAGFAHLTEDFVQRYAYEGWVMEDVDATPPKLPETCSLVTAPASGQRPAGTSALASTMTVLSFTWSGATDNGGSGILKYRVYWGTNPEGQSPYVETENPSFSTSAIPAGPTYYLRVQVIDRANNASAWKTLQALALAP